MTPEEIAQVCHEANRRYQKIIGEPQSPTWEDASWAMKQSAIAGVVFVQENPWAKLSALHETWYAHKKAQGWKYGLQRDEQTLEHPCMVAYDQLSNDQQIKDGLFKSIVLMFSPSILVKGEPDAN